MKRLLVALFVVAFAAGYVHAGSTGPGSSGGGSAVTATQSGTWTVQQGTAPWSTTISGTPAVTVASGSLTCTGPLTDTQLRATPVPVSGTVTATGPLTDTQIRATALPVSGPLTDTQIRATALPVSGTVTCSGPLTDTQLRASAVPVSGPATDTQLRATPLPVSGTTTATQGTAAAAPGAWTVKVTDGTSVGFVTPASTAAVAANPAQVVALHPTSPLPTGTNTLGSVKLTDGTTVPFVTPASTAAVAANPALTVALHPTSPLPTGSNTIGALTANQSVNLSQIAAGTAINGGVTGTLAAGGTTANNAAAAGNPMQLAGYSWTDGTSPTATTAGNVTRLLTTTDGRLVTTTDHPKRVRCFVAASTAATITAFGSPCAAPGAGLSLYITDINFSSSVAGGTAADSFPTIKYGTGGTCGTGTTVLWAALNAANTPVVESFITPLKVPANNELCWIDSTAGTRVIVVSGYIAP